MENFKRLGTWWNDNTIEMVAINGDKDEVYALNGWNGEKYTKSWKCSGVGYMEASEEEYVIAPQYEEIDGEYHIVGYEVE